MPTAKKSVADLEAENQDAIDRLAKKREQIEALRTGQVDDTQRVSAEMHAAQLAEEEARLDAQLAAEKDRSGITKIRDARPRLSGEIDDEQRAEAEAQVAENMKAAAEANKAASTPPKKPTGE